MHKLLYDNGQYNEMDPHGTQVTIGLSRANGIGTGFLMHYAVLTKLRDYTQIRDEGKGTFLMIDNETTHSATLLQEPAYEPAQSVNNVEYDREHPTRTGLDGSEIRLTTIQQMKHYQTNMATMIQLGKWMDYMRENGVYDSTRIILVADHGHGLDGLFDLRLNSSEDMLSYNPLLMVKDFDSRGFAIDDTFMTNADTPLLALDGLMENIVNPFTGKPLTDAQKHEPEQFVVNTKNFRPEKNLGTQYTQLRWYANANNVLDLSAWRKIEGELE